MRPGSSAQTGLVGEPSISCNPSSPHIVTFTQFSVNLGGWLVLEPFITPAIYEKYPGAVDEWTLHTLMAADTASGGLQQLDDHYNTFIVRYYSVTMSRESFLIVVISDRGRFCSDRGRRPQLG